LLSPFAGAKERANSQFRATIIFLFFILRAAVQVHEQEKSRKMLEEDGRKSRRSTRYRFIPCYAPLINI
jgi:hypothetical protein